MIEINLIKKQVDKVIASPVIEGGPEFNFSEEIDISGLLFRFLLLILAPGILYSYEFYNKASLERSLPIIQNKTKSIELKLSGVRNKLEEIKRNKKKADSFAARVNLLKNLARSRLFEVRALDSLQSILPQQVSLVSIEYNRKAKTIEFFGNAKSRDYYNDFLSRMDQTPYFYDNVTVKAERESDRLRVNFRLTSSVSLGNE